LRLKLGIRVAASTVRQHLVRPAGPQPSNWSRFVLAHADQMFALDFATQHLWNFSVRHVLVVMALDTRRIVHVAVTKHPTLAWVKQQIREATPYGDAPRFLLHDNDGIFGQFGKSRSEDEPGRYREEPRRHRCALDVWLDRVIGIRGLPIPYGAPNVNAYVERFMRTLRQECLRNFIFVSEGHLRRTVSEYVRYYNNARVHQGTGSIPTPEPRAMAPPGANAEFDRVESRAVLGGLIRDYRRAA